MMFLWALSEVILYEVLNALGGYPLVRKVITNTRASNNSINTRLRLIKQVTETVDTVCCFYVRRIGCLHRSFVAVRLLRKLGVNADLVIGVRPVPFLSHAWVEFQNEIVNDRKGYRQKLLVMERL